MFSKNTVFFIILCLFLVFGVIFYDTISFNYTDEILTLTLGLLAVLCIKKEYLLRPPRELISLYALLFIFGFYLCYSIIIKSNVKVAVFQDFTVQIKPFLAFFATLFIAPCLNKSHKSVLRTIAISGILFLVFVVLYGIATNNIMRGIVNIVGHPSRFATTATICAFLFLYASKDSKKSLILFFLFLSVGCFSLRAKFIGFYVICIILIYFYKGFSLKLSFKTAIALVLSFVIVVYFTFDKIDFYFIGGNDDFKETFARPALYLGATKILSENLFFGSGFASYATFYSGEYYSKLYYKLDMDMTWGLTPDDHPYIADTYYPALAQFGMIGIILFIYFFYKVASTANKYKKAIDISYIKQYTLIVLIILFFIIESVADATITHNRGVFMMILMALCLNDLKQKAKKENNIEKNFVPL